MSRTKKTESEGKAPPKKKQIENSRDEEKFRDKLNEILDRTSPCFRDVFLAEESSSWTEKQKETAKKMIEKKTNLAFQEKENLSEVIENPEQYMEERYPDPPSRIEVTRIFKCKARKIGDQSPEAIYLKSKDTHYRLEPFNRIRRLIDGNVKTATLTLTVTEWEYTGSDVVENRRLWPMAPFVWPDFSLTKEEKYAMRKKGIYPVEEAKGETTRKQSVRLDSESMRQTRLLALWRKQETGNE